MERVPADIRRDGGVARMSDPKLIKEIMDAVTIPVFAKVRIGHFAEAQILEALNVDMIDESEVLTPADDEVKNIFTYIARAQSFTSLKAVLCQDIINGGRFYKWSISLKEVLR